jgi:hypothetical protein
MKKNTLIKVILAALGFSVLAPAFAFAQVGAAVNTNASANTTVTPTSASLNAHTKVTASSTAETTRAARAKDKGDQEIDRRVTALNALMTRVNEMTKITEQIKTSIKTNIQNQIDGFVALKSKIDADTDLATLKTDVQSITQSYRIYILVVPQARITAAADRMATVINMMGEVGTKLQARVNTAKSAGADTASLEAALTDLASKLTSAQGHAQAAVTAIAPLAPDQGDKTVQATNDAAIKKAQGEIKAGTGDLVDARKDIATIVGGLAKLKTNANVNSNASTTVNTQ